MIEIFFLLFTHIKKNIKERKISIPEKIAFVGLGNCILPESEPGTC